MKIAYTGWTWLINHQDNHRFEFEQFLKEVHDLGYQAVENFAFVAKYFDFDAEEINRLLQKYQLEFCNLYLHYSEDPEEDYKNAQIYVDFMKKIGAKYLNLQAVMWKDEPNLRPTDRARIEAYARLSDQIGQLCQENGMVACFHPHANTAIFTQEQIDHFLACTRPEWVKLCLDTAHTTIAGMDAVAAFTQYADRIGYVHLKDVLPDPARLATSPMECFCPLGDGTIDFPGVHRALATHGYDGYLCVELDRQPVCNYKSAMVSRRYLHDVLGF